METTTLPHFLIPEQKVRIPDIPIIIGTRRVSVSADGSSWTTKASCSYQWVPVSIAYNVSKIIALFFLTIKVASG